MRKYNIAKKTILYGILKLRTRNRTPRSLAHWTRLAALEITAAIACALAFGVLEQGHLKMNVDVGPIQITIKEKGIQIVTADDETSQSYRHANHGFAHFIQGNG